MCVCVCIYIHSNFLFLKLIYYFWLHWVFVAASGLSLAAVSGGCSSLCCGASDCCGFSHCGAQAQGPQASVADCMQAQ